MAALAGGRVMAYGAAAAGLEAGVNVIVEVTPASEPVVVCTPKL